MTFTPFSMTTVFKASQLAKASSLIDCTLPGIVTDSIPLNWNALEPMVVTVFGMMVFMNP